VSDGKSTVGRGLTIEVRGPSVALEDLNLSHLNNQIFTTSQQIQLAYPALPVEFEWNFAPVRAVNDGSSSAAPAFVLRTATPRMQPGALGLEPGDYLLTVVVRQTDNPSNSRTATASLKIVGANSAFDNLRVYPNPWKQSKHTEGVRFNGLPAGTRIKIFTSSGHLVKDMAADAAVTQWSVTTDKGDRAASGVYLYLLTEPNGGMRRGKVAVIR
jgi:hypothetical protein